MIEALLSTLLVSGLVFPGIAAYTAVYVTLAAMIALLIGTRRQVWRSPIIISLGIGGAALTLSILLNGGAPDHWMALVMLLPFAGCVAVGSTAGKVSPLHFGALCLFGALAALAVGLVEVFVMEARRAGWGNNPIHYASLAVMLGFISLVGATGSRSPMRFIFLLGPIAACAVALLSGSRGPLAAACVLLVLALIVFRRDRMFFAGVLALPLLAGVGLIVSGEGGRALVLFQGLMAQRTLNSDGIRLQMYQAALSLFAESPIWGQGLGNLMAQARELYPDIRPRYDNLHSDIANLAAIGGILGIICYFAIVFSPLVALLNSSARQNDAVLFLALSLTGGNAMLGLTNAILGLLPQMTLFVLMLGYLVALERRAAADAPGSADV